MQPLLLLLAFGRAVHRGIGVEGGVYTGEGGVLSEASIPCRSRPGHDLGEVDGSVDPVAQFTAAIFNVLGLVPELLLVVLVYIDRMVKHSEVSLTEDNWKWIVAGYVLLAAKVFDDKAHWVSDLQRVFVVQLDHLNNLERVLLQLLAYDVEVSSTEYTHHYLNSRQYLRPTELVDSFTEIFYEYTD